MQGYSEALQLIATFGQAYISKSYLYNNKTSIQKHHLRLNKNLIKHTLGPINHKKSQYLTQQDISSLLKQLQLQPQYNYYNKNFKITIPLHRSNDLYRKIDIIEEISRIYGYQNFIDNIPYINKKGHISKQYQIIKDIRQYFRDLGLHEVINSSLNKIPLPPAITNHTSSTINIYNPLLADQSYLRHNLLDNIIKNKIYNYKQKNNNIEIFEIGKVFKENKTNYTQQEEIHIAGILSNQTFIKQSWQTKPSKLNWFHAKGILEQFFEKMQIAITWHPINTLNEKENKSVLLNNFDLKNTICIGNAINNQIIGYLGLIDHNICKEISKEATINIFELNIHHLINYAHKQSHLSYIFENYSIYPSVTRDISIKINKDVSINTIQQFIFNLNKKLIQNVEIFNQYKDIENINKKCVGIRITYNGINRTLDQNDLELIENDITFILQTYQSK